MSDVLRELLELRREAEGASETEYRRGYLDALEEAIDIAENAEKIGE